MKYHVLSLCDGDRYIPMVSTFDTADYTDVVDVYQMALHCAENTHGILTVEVGSFGDVKF